MSKILSRARSRGVVILFFLITVIVLPASSESRKVYRFGYASSQSGEILFRRMSPMMTLFSEVLDADIEFVHKKTFSEMQKAFINQEIDFGILNAYSYLRVLPYNSIIPIASRVIEDSQFYQTYFFARKDSGIETIEDLKGKIVALGDPYSTSSYLIPNYIFMQKDIHPEHDFGQTIIVTKQDSLILSVMNRTADAGVAASFIFNEQPESIRTSLNIFFITDPFPLGPFVVNENIDSEIVYKLKQTLLELNDSEEGRKALQSAGLEGFQEVRTDSYKTLSAIIKMLNLN